MLRLRNYGAPRDVVGSASNAGRPARPAIFDGKAITGAVERALRQCARRRFVVTILKDGNLLADGTAEMRNQPLVFLEAVTTAVFVESRIPYSWACHRRPDRSFIIRGRQFHLCARCTGLMIGLLLAPVPILLGAALVPFACAATAALLIDGVTQYAKLRTSTNILRFGTGVATSASLFAVLISAVFHVMGHVIGIV